jgi:hypothetical protein
MSPTFRTSGSGSGADASAAAEETEAREDAGCFGGLGSLGIAGRRGLLRHTCDTGGRSRSALRREPWLVASAMLALRAVPASSHERVLLRWPRAWHREASVAQGRFGGRAQPVGAGDRELLRRRRVARVCDVRRRGFDRSGGQEMVTERKQRQEGIRRRRRRTATREEQSSGGRNPMSGSGMKQGRQARGGSRRREVEKT